MLFCNLMDTFARYKRDEAEEVLTDYGNEDEAEQEQREAMRG